MKNIKFWAVFFAVSAIVSDLACDGFMQAKLNADREKFLANEVAGKCDNIEFLRGKNNTNINTNTIENSTAPTPKSGLKL